MTHSSLYWHCATYVANANGNRRPPHEHQLIAVAGIRVGGEGEDDTGQNLIVDVWGLASPKPQKLIRATVANTAPHDEFVTFYGRSFGLPVLAANALKTGVQLGYIGVNEQHQDLTETVRNLIAPSNGLTFDAVLDLMQLPMRPELDILATWESQNPKVKQRIPQRLVIDCCFIALTQVRLRYLVSDVGAEYVRNFTRAVLSAAAAKVPKVKTVFADLLAELAGAPAKVANTNESEEDDLDDEPETDNETTADVVDSLGSFDDFDDLDDDDL
ncbi:hypothetical protein LCGC14_0698720 [marine sediment metagenome]|uniref:Uncharacterized protein n=1 Tax=marine sediment metagenome TaxID=412755 RepID=A0A0F9TR57_9ZZZZ